MTVRSLFSIIIKILGIFFIKDILLALPQLIGFVSFTLSPSYEGGTFGTIALFILSIGAYLMVAYYLLFKTDWIITKFQLDRGFEVDPIRLTMHRSTILSICIIVIGSLMFINAVPSFIRHAIAYYHEAKLTRMLEHSPGPDISYLISYGLQIIAGLLLLGNQREVVNFIERRRMKTYEDETPE